MIQKLCFLCFLLFSSVRAAVPQLINHQGRIAVNGTNFEGTGQFKFALVNSTGTTTYWSNDDTSTASSQPTAAVSLPVVKGLYAVLLGDAGMTALPASAFDNADVRLRVWFNDGVIGFQQITPDQRLAAAPFALNAAQAESVPNATITNAKLANAAVTINAGTGLGGGGSVALGSNISLSNAGVLSLSGGGGISVSGSTGAITLGSSGTSANTPSTLVLRDASGNFTAGTITAALAGNATTATSATNFSGSLAGEVTGTQSATAISAATVTGKAITGFSSTTGTITASDTILTAINKLNGNDLTRAPLASPTFTGTVTGTFSGNGSALTNLSGGNIASGSVGSTQITDLSIVNADISNSAAIADSKLATLSTAGKVANSATTATAANTASSIVLRDASGNFTAGTITAALTGNASTATSATSFTGSLAGEVTGTQSATAIAATVVTGKVITGFSSTTGTITASDTILTAINKLNGNDNTRAPLASPTFTGTVTGTFSGNGAALTNLSGGNITTGSVGSTQITDGSIVNADVSTSAAIADSKLATLSSAGKVANSATTGTSANTANALVLRDASGNFSAGTMTGTFIGDGSGLTNVTASTVLLPNILAAPIKPVVAWGDNHDGQTALPSSLSNANTAAIAAGSTVSVALLKTGTVVQWGSSTVVPGGLSSVTHIAAGADHRLARKSDGTVIAWGDNTYGQSTVPGGITTAINVSAGEKHSLALRANGTVVAWGDSTFTQTTIPGTATNVTAIACGYDHSLALKADGTVIAWGRNDSGQVTGTYPSVGVIADIIDSTRFRLSTNLASGTTNLRYDGTTVISSSGDGSDIVTVASTSGLSQGMTVTRANLVGPSGLSGVIAIACGAYHSLVVKSDGSVVAWGWDSGGQVSGAAALSGISKVAGGYAFTLAQKNDGTLVAFGDNTDLQTVIPAEAINVTAIACGASHALALRADLISAQVARLDQDNIFTGKVGIQRTPAGNALEVQGNASKTTAGNWLANSDRRIKTDVRTVQGAVRKLSQVHLVDFNYTDDYRATHPDIEDKRYLNVIAQEFQKVFPNDVKSSGEKLPDGSAEILQVDTYPLTIYAAAAVQELAEENEKLKKQLSEQEARLKKLEALIK